MNSESKPISRRAFLKVAGGAAAVFSAAGFHAALLQAALAADAKKKTKPTKPAKPAKPQQPKPEPAEKVLSPKDLGDAELNAILKAALGRGGDFSEVFVQQRVEMNYRLVNGKLLMPQSVILSGAGIRVVNENRIGYAYCEQLTESNVLKAAQKASFQISNGEAATAHPVEKQDHKQNQTVTQTFESLQQRQKLDLLAKIERAARQLDQRVKSVEIVLCEASDYRVVASSTGRWVVDVTPSLYLTVAVIAENKGQRGSGYWHDGACMGYEWFNVKKPEAIGKVAAEQALANLEARAMTSASLPAVLGTHCGIVLGVAVSHALGLDQRIKGKNDLQALSGRQLGSTQVTIYDDATLSNKFGSYNVDDEGFPAQRTTIVSKGKIDKPIANQLEAKTIRQLSTGSGRRESYRFAPLTAVSNLFLEAGKATHEDLVKGTSSGVYVEELNETPVRISDDVYLFPIREGYLIKNGQITNPVKNLAIVEDVGEMLNNIERTANNLVHVAHFYQVQEQRLPVTFGMPSIKLSKANFVSWGQ